MPKGKRTTHETFVRKVKEAHGGEIEVLSQFKRTKDKVRFRHKCGYEWESIANSVGNQGCGCPKCAKNAMLTTEEFRRRVKDVCGDDVTILGEYTGSSRTIRVRYGCGHESRAHPYDILSGHRCNKCKLRRTHDQYVKDLAAKYGDEYSILGEYTTVYTKAPHRHNSCGYVWEARPNALLMGHLCPRCADTTKTHDEYIDLLKGVHGDIVKVIGNYAGYNTKILHEHICGHRWAATPHGILLGRSCPRCFGAVKKTHKQYEEEIKKKFGKEYSVTEMYQGASSKIRHRHNPCGTEWSIKPNTLLSGYGCPFCNISKGEKMLNELLTDCGLQFERQYKFTDCRGKRRPLPFDFAVIRSGKIAVLIEWDGRQHFQPVKKFNGREGLLERKRNDRIKDEYCAKKGIPLLRIPYWLKSDQVESMIDAVLNKGQVTLPI